MALFQQQRDDIAAAPPLPGDRRCIDCGVKIPPARAALLPRATRCCHCQSGVEAR